MDMCALEYFIVWKTFVKHAPGHYLVHFKKSSVDRTFPSQAKEARQPVCAPPLRLQDPPPGLSDSAAGRGQLQGELTECLLDVQV